MKDWRDEEEGPFPTGMAIGLVVLVLVVAALAILCGIDILYALGGLE